MCQTWNKPRKESSAKSRGMLLCSSAMSKYGFFVIRLVVLRSERQLIIQKYKMMINLQPCCEIRDWAKTVTKHTGGFHHESTQSLSVFSPLLLRSSVFFLPTWSCTHLVHRPESTHMIMLWTIWSRSAHDFRPS
jgi:hypothetical protein